jgi:hypothetical protein
MSEDFLTTENILADRITFRQVRDEELHLLRQHQDELLTKVLHENRMSYHSDPYTRNLVDVLINIATESPEWEKLTKDYDGELAPNEQRDALTGMLLRLPIIQAIVMDIKQGPRRSTEHLSWLLGIK